MSQKLSIRQNIWFCSSIDSEPQQGEITVPLRDQSLEIRMPNGRRRLLDASQIYLTRQDAEQAALLRRPETVAAKISSLPKLLSFLYSQGWRDTPAGSPVDQAVREKIKELADIEVAVETEAKPAVVKPVAYTIADQSYPFATWIDSLIKHCEVIIEKHGIDAFAEKALAIKTTARATKRKVFAESEEDMRGFAFHKFSDTLFLLKNQNSAQVELINKQLNEAFPEEAIDYSFE